MSKPRKPKSRIPSAVRAWSEADRKAWADGLRPPRASTIPGKRKPAPTVKEYA